MTGRAAGAGAGETPDETVRGSPGERAARPDEPVGRTGEPAGRAADEQAGDDVAGRGDRGPGPSEPPRRRVVVTGPRRRGPQPRPVPVATEIDEQTALGEVYVRSLIRAQLRLAALVCVALAVVLGGLPLLFVFLPRIGQLTLLGVPLPWLLLGAAIYPLLIAFAAYYVHRAEANERAFADLVDR